MTDLLLINNRTFVPVKKAVLDFGYSRDHITRLAKAKKIVALQIGRRWYVKEDSVKSYFDSQRIENAIKQQHLKLSRKQEFELRTSIVELQTKHVQKVRLSNIAAIAIASILFISTFYVGSVVLPQANQSAALVAEAVATKQVSATDYIQPKFTDNTHEVAISNTRSVERPVVNPDWQFISP